MMTLRTLLDEHGKDWPDANFNERAVRLVEQAPLRFRITKPGCEEHWTAQPVARIGGHRGEWAMLLYPAMCVQAEHLMLVEPLAEAEEAKR